VHHRTPAIVTAVALAVTAVALIVTAVALVVAAVALVVAAVALIVTLIVATVLVVVVIVIARQRNKLGHRKNLSKQGVLTSWRADGQMIHNRDRI